MEGNFGPTKGHRGLALKSPARKKALRHPREPHHVWDDRLAKSPHTGWEVLSSAEFGRTKFASKTARGIFVQA
jgi:hypothetical protein